MRDVDLRIEEGSTIAIIGQNGSGKTTLVKHFNGLLRPTKGKVLVGGEDTSTKTVSQLSTLVGYVFQNPNHQLFCTTVDEEVQFGLKNMELPQEERLTRVKEALSFLGIEKHRYEHPYSLSLGQKKLVAIASVYAMHPRVIVLDEPTTGLDHIGVKAISKIVKQMTKEHTIIIITHHMPFVAECTKRAVVMYSGEIIADDDPREIFTLRDTMEKASLHPPQITELAHRLMSFGFPSDILTPKEMSDELGRRIS